MTVTEPRTTSAMWQALLADPRHPRPVDRPAPGYYRTKLRRGGPWVAARIWGEGEPESLFCIVGDRERDPHAAWPSLQAITPEAYAALQHANRTNPAFHPTSTIDLTKEIITP